MVGLGTRVNQHGTPRPEETDQKRWTAPHQPEQNR